MGKEIHEATRHSVHRCDACAYATVFIEGLNRLGFIERENVVIEK